MIGTVMGMTSAEALANLEPYDDTDSNTVVNMFYDTGDGNILKGIFFDSTVTGEKVVRQIGGSVGGATRAFTVTMDKATVNDLQNTAVLITAIQLGLSAGFAANVIKDATIWSVKPDGVPFVNGLDTIDIKNPSNSGIASIGGLVSTAVDAKFNTFSQNDETLDDNADYNITASGAIAGGGVNSSVSVTLFYRIISLV